MAEKTRFDIFSKLGGALNNPTHSDLTVIVEDTTFYAHKVILDLYTPYFTEVIKGNAEEVEQNVEELEQKVEEVEISVEEVEQESVEEVEKAIVEEVEEIVEEVEEEMMGRSVGRTNGDVVMISEHSIGAVRGFLEYCYTGGYRDDGAHPAFHPTSDIGLDKAARIPATPPNGTLHLRVHSLADMLDVPELKELATMKLQEHLETRWAEGFVDLVKEVYNTTSSFRDKDFREVVVRSAFMHLDEHLKVEEFDNLMGDVGEFSAALVRLLKVGQQGSAGPTHLCIFCKVACGWQCRKCGTCY
ncbi:hypothetical protein BDD12DRAFT_887545 [Trichophaea hybrida]|nr:hypothetical protein BDD12DRAFT_887545 [Trichophaea hybrida]